MTAKKEYMLTESEYHELLRASQPTPLVPELEAKGYKPLPAEHAATAVWKKISYARGFLWRTVEPVPGKDHRYFLAEPISNSDESE